MIIKNFTQKLIEYDRFYFCQCLATHTRFCESIILYRYRSRLHSHADQRDGMSSSTYWNSRRVRQNTDIAL